MVIIIIFFGTNLLKKLIKLITVNKISFPELILLNNFNVLINKIL